jgi:hypothetical protein
MNKLMREILYAMAFLQENKMVHGDLRPSFIGVPLSRNGKFYLLDRLGNPASPEKVQMHNIDSENDLYISPSLFKAILKKKKQIKHDPYKSDIFAFGMILLEAGILESVQSVYNKDKKTINESILVEFVEKFIDKYPDDVILQEGLMIMLEFSEKLRQTPIEMIDSLRQLKESEKEENGMTNSYLNYTADHMMNKVKVTDSGYEYNGADQMNMSSFSRIYNRSITGNDEYNSERKSLMDMMKNKNAKAQGSVRNEFGNKQIEVRRGFNVRMETVEKVGLNKQNSREYLHSSNNQKDDDLFQSFKQLSGQRNEETKETSGKQKYVEVTANKGEITQNVFDINEYMEYYEVKSNQIDTNTPQNDKRIIVNHNNHIRLENVPQTVSKRVYSGSSFPESSYTVEKIENDSKNIKESTEKKRSVYDLVSPDQYDGLTIENDNLDIIQEEGVEGGNIPRNKVNKIKLYKGPVTNLMNNEGLRQSLSFESRPESKMKVITTVKKNDQNLIQITRKAGNFEIQSNKNEVQYFSKENIIKPKDSLHPDFGMSQQRFNEELLSQLPTDPFKNQTNEMEKPKNSTVKSNFTYGQNSKPSNQFKSEILGETLQDETRVRRKSVKKQITKEEYERIIKENQGKTKSTTIRRISVKAQNSQYHQISGNQQSPRSSSNHQTIIVKSNNSRFDSTENTNIVQFSAKRQGTYNTVTNGEIKSNTYGSLTHKKMNSFENNKYKTYTYERSNRFGNSANNQGERVVTYSRSRSPAQTDPRKVRKSSKKVIVYRNGVKVSEKVYNNPE